MLTTLVMKPIFEFINLLFIRIFNIIYNLGLWFYEFIYFFRYLWWWKLQFLLNSYYFFSNPYLEADSKNPDYIYGETPFITMFKILKELDLKDKKTFADLGCGRGKPVFLANIYFNLDACGFDTIEPFIKKAERIKGVMKLDGINFIRRDMVDVNLGDFEIIFITPTTFSDETLIKIEEKIDWLNDGACLISLSVPFLNKNLDIIKKKRFWFTWGGSTVYFYQKRTK